jgi:hypothetical protein
MITVSTIDGVLEALGGPDAARSLAGVKSQSAPFNWKKRGRIPTEHFLVFAEALRSQGKEADPALFGFNTFDEARA